MTPHLIRILCVDDHPIVTEGLAAIISRQPDMMLVAVADSVETAISQFAAYAPDITLMDLRLRDRNGIDAIHAIRRQSPDARIIVLTVHQGDEDIYRALQAGASAYLLKEQVPDELVHIIRQVYCGEVPSMRPDLRERLVKRSVAPVLTSREIQVLELVSRGLRNKEIAAVLGISNETARVHVKNILAKLEVSDRSAAINVGVRRGLIHLGE